MQTTEIIITSSLSRLSMTLGELTELALSQDIEFIVDGDMLKQTV